MAFQIFHLDHSTEVNPPLESLEALYDELDSDGEDHGFVTVVHESGWSLNAQRNRVLTWRRIRLGGSKHMRRMSKRRVLALWRMLVDGQWIAIDKQPWERGQEIEVGPRQHLKSIQISRGAAVYRVLGRFLGMRFRHFRVRYLERGDADEMIAYWERIAAAFARYTKGRYLSEKQEQAVFENLLEIAFTGPTAVEAAHAYWDELAAIYESAQQSTLPATMEAMSPAAMTSVIGATAPAI